MCKIQNTFRIKTNFYSCEKMHKRISIPWFKISPGIELNNKFSIQQLQ